MAALYDRVFQDRTQSIALHCKQPDGSLMTVTKTGIWRVLSDADPVMGARGNDALAMFKSTDVTLTQLRSVAYAHPTTPQGPEPATRYTITSIAPRGFPVGEDRIFVSFKRQR